MIYLQLIFWTGIFLILYSYLVFPLILRILGRKKKSAGHDSASTVFSSPDNVPFLSVLISAYNEEEVIEEKITSLLNSDYPRDKVEILVGSDASTDRSNELISAMAEREDILKFCPFNQRQGKPEIINRLAEEARGQILIITDANVMLDKDTLMLLAESFSHPDIGLVDTQMINTRLQKEGVSYQEGYYISREVGIKHLESILWGSMMGPFGGCYAVRKELYVPVPGHFLVDDFFINMSVLQKGSKCISNIRAKVFEEATHDLGEEFRRKKRISAGNFQNLGRFASMLFSGRAPVAFCFFSHKVIRWIVPLIVFITLGTSLAAGLSGTPFSKFYLGLAGLQILVILTPLIDLFLRKIKIQSIPLRFISHFVLMNLALLAGFFRYTGGIKSNVWQPTKRKQGKPQ